MANVKPIVATVGAAFLASVATTQVATASENPFATTELGTGYNTVANNEGKCGEGKCGGEKVKEEGKCGEGKCGGDKASSEGKCGEGKCGGDKVKKEGKCGEGKCGGNG